MRNGKLPSGRFFNFCYLTLMLRFLIHSYWKARGWKIAGNFPYEVRKMVIIVAPHTSWIDLVVGLAARDLLRIQHSRFFGKKELFFWPLGAILRRLGGTPVDRFSKHGVVEQAVALFAENKELVLALAPEGTRKKVDKLRTGFYHIAKKAHVPILTVGLDYKNHQVVIGSPFLATGDESADLDRMLDFFSTMQGKNPDRDLHHLKPVREQA